MCFQMSPQTACPTRCIVTLVAFLWSFHIVYFDMCFQGAYPRGCIFTLVAFVWFLHSVSFFHGITYTWIIFSKMLIHYHHVKYLSQTEKKKKLACDWEKRNWKWKLWLKTMLEDNTAFYFSNTQFPKETPWRLSHNALICESPSNLARILLIGIF